MSQKHPPGPAGHWLLGNLGLLRSDVLGMLENVPREHGDLATLRMGPYRVLLLSHPRWVEQVLVTENRIFQRPPRFTRIVRAIFGNGLFASQGATWLAQRRIVQAALDRIPLARHSQNVVQTAHQTIEGWENEGESDLEHRMIELSFAIRARATLGIDSTDTFDATRACLRTFMDYFADRMKHPFAPPLWVPTPGNQRIRVTIDSWWKLITEYVQQPYRGDEAPDYLLGILQALGEDPKYAMPQHQLRDEIATWLMTGTETVSNIFSWTWFLLANHPDACDRLYDEVDSVLQGKPAVHSDLGSLQYTKAILREAMRLYPQAYIIGRKATAPFTMGEFTFPQGTTVMLNQWFIGRDPRWFDDPLKFDPGRWDESRPNPSKFADFPFGRGPRTCAGKPLAMIDMVLALASLAQRFEFQLASTGSTHPIPTLTLRPAEGMRVNFSRRQKPS